MNKNSTILLTGPSSGIGLDLLLRLLHKGYSVLGVSRTRPPGKLPESYRHLECDFSKPDFLSDLFPKVESALDQMPALYALILNAGYAQVGPLAELSDRALRQQLDVNLFAPANLTQRLLPRLEKTKGRIIPITSVAGRISFPFLGAYCMSKHALEAWANALRPEVANRGIRVCTIAPGPVKTPIWEKSKNIVKTPQDKRWHLALEKFSALAARSGENGVSAKKVSKAILHALEFKNPKTHYLVGHVPVLSIRLPTMIPTRLMDALIRKKLGLS